MYQLKYCSKVCGADVIRYRLGRTNRKIGGSSGGRNDGRKRSKCDEIWSMKESRGATVDDDESVEEKCKRSVSSSG